MESNEIEKRAIEFFKKETETDQVTSPVMLGIIKLMILFAKSENAELEEIIKRKNLGIDKLIVSCDEISCFVSKLMEQYDSLSNRYKESQELLKRDFKNDINTNLN
jgi:hypothetical protein